MATNAFLGGITFSRLDTTVSPNAYVAISEINDLSSFGETTPLVDVTHFDSTSREYIGGLADGTEFTLGCNRVHTSPDLQAVLIADKGLTRSFKITHTDTSVSPNTVVTYTFDAVVMGWTIEPSIDDKNTISFTFKLSGGVTIA